MDMSTTQKLTRSDHVASLELPPGKIIRALGQLRRRDVLLRISISFAAAMVAWLACSAWREPFTYRLHEVPSRDIVSRVAFSVPDPEQTEQLRKQKRSETLCVYRQDDRPLKELRSALIDRVFQVIAADDFAKLSPGIWSEFQAESRETTDDTLATFERFRGVLLKDKELDRFASALQRAFHPFEEHGLLEGLQHSPPDGSQISILIYPLGDSEFLQRFEVTDVRIAEATADFSERLKEELVLAEFSPDDSKFLQELVSGWLDRHGIPTTLTIDSQATQREYQEAVSSIRVDRHFHPGDLIARGGFPLTADKLKLLADEHAAVLAHRTLAEQLNRSLAYLGMYVGLFSLGGAFIYYYQRAILSNLRHFTALIGAAVVTVVLARICHTHFWQAEIVPVTLFAMTAAIAYRRELTLLLSALVTLAVGVSLGLALGEFVVLLSSLSATILLLDRIRSRTKLIYVGLGVSLVTMLTAIGVGILAGRPILAHELADLPPPPHLLDGTPAFLMQLISESAWQAFCVILASLIMTGLLPFIERLFDVQTDISLLELGDAAHPLLQQLARRSPGTYNHSINVAAMAEAAAEAIGANGLLVRVGTYFHDIGKMFKPVYFVENRGQEDDRHQSLVPAMSTLVIIAHVKDGADLARQHHLPQSIIDFIEQHHGTTLVEYFYQQATRQKEVDPDRETVDERNFRYPGPKPQNRETAILMLADAVESISRTLTEPTPARIRSVVQDVAMRRLLDGQFDECGITLKELSIVRDSLSKSLAAVYHARVKYPDQQTA